MISAKTSLLIFSILFGGMACEEKDEESELDSSLTGYSQGFLVAADIAVPSTTVELTSEGMIESLAGVTDFYNNKPSGEGSSDDEFSKCLSGFLDSLVVHASGEKIYFGNEFDILTCLGSVFDESTATVTVNSSVLKYFFSGTCPGTDLGQYDGIKLGDMGDDGESNICDSGESELDQSRLSVDVTLEEDGASANLTIDSISHTGASDLGEVSSTVSGDQIAVSDDFLGVSISTTTFVFDGETEKSVDHVRTTASSVSGDHNTSSTYYSSGAFNVTIDNWTGTVTNVDASTAPEYMMTDGTSTVSGTFSPGLALKSPIFSQVGFRLKNRFQLP